MLFYVPHWQNTTFVLLNDPTSRDLVNLQVMNKGVLEDKETAELIPEYKWGFNRNRPLWSIHVIWTNMKTYSSLPLDPPSDICHIPDPPHTQDQWLASSSLADSSRLFFL